MLTKKILKKCIKLYSVLFFVISLSFQLIKIVFWAIPKIEKYMRFLIVCATCIDKSKSIIKNDGSCFQLKYFFM